MNQDLDTAQIEALVNGFRENLHSLRDQQTPEAVIRQEYIDPFWQALGWDVSNAAHRSLAEKDVVIEATVETVEAGAVRSRRPDYLFRIDGFPRFVVEAKKPAVDIQTDRDAIFQAKTYAWSAQIPFALLTDFEEFRLFDATLKPYHDRPDQGLVAEFDLRFEDYVQQWDVLSKVFSRNAVAAGSLEALLAKIKHVRSGRRIRGIDRMLIDLRGSEPVDQAFLTHLENYRLRFARALYQNNRTAFPEAGTRHGAARLTEATQRLIDRLVFIRVCEDRNIVPYGDLRDIVNRSSQNRLDLSHELAALFRRLDTQYNGYLFKPHFSEQLDASTELLAEFIRTLYPPEGPYRFDAIGDDLLGTIYERFLGSTITVTRSQVDAEEKPEVRHAGGVYYTPRFVVDAIVRRVLGPKVEGKTPAQVLDLTILDPACGSGSFLIGALQFLFDYCVRYLTAHPEASVIPATPRSRTTTTTVGFQDDEGQWHVHPDFRARLLSSCIYGVDIDSQAIEVTIMSLYLKLLEGKAPPNWQQTFLRSHLLPPMDNNIRCGNSLLSHTDFDRYWDDKYGSLFGGDEETRFRLNAFDWDSATHGFGRIVSSRGGFDCIIGNPPYIRVQELKRWSPEECEFFKTRYDAAQKGNYDIYVAFIERGIELLAEDGLLGFICPHKFWQATYGKGIRTVVASGRHLRSVVDFTDQQVFVGATTYTAIHVFGRTPNPATVDYSRVVSLVDGESQCRAFERDIEPGRVDISRWPVNHPQSTDPVWSFVPLNAPVITTSEAEGRVRLADIVRFSQGFKTGADRVFVVEVVRREGRMTRIRSEATGAEHVLETGLLRALIKSEHMRRFEIRPTALVLVFPYSVSGDNWRLLEPAELVDEFPVAWSSYLLPLRTTLDRRESGRFGGEHFYQYSRQQNFVPLSRPKLITPDMADTMRFSFDSEGQFVFSGGAAGGVCMIPNPGVNPLFLMGVLNSQLIEEHLRQRNGAGFRGGYLNCEIRFLRDIPIPRPTSSAQRRLSDQIVERVSQIVDGKQRLQSTGLGDRERVQTERDISQHETRINDLVCRLYGVDAQ